MDRADANWRIFYLRNLWCYLVVVKNLSMCGQPTRETVFMFVITVIMRVIRYRRCLIMEIVLMTPEGKQKLKHLLVSHENYKQFPYTDSTGHLTVGIGRNLTNRGISTTEAFYLLDEDILYFSSKLNHFLHSFVHLSENRQIALIDMCFNVGVQGYLNFDKMVAALEMHDYDRAAQEMLDSKWAEQVGDRATTLANIIRTGQI